MSWRSDCDESKTREELLKIARQDLDEKDVGVLLENFGTGLCPKRD